MLSDIKRFVILTQDYFPTIGGITTYCYEVGNQLQLRGYNVLCITKSFDGYTGEEEHNIPVVRLKHRRWKNYRNQRIYRALKPYIADDTVFLCANWKVAVACMFASFTRRVRYFVIVHGLDALEPRRLNRRLQRLTLSRAAGVVIGSRYTAGLLRPLGIADKTPQRIINCGVDVSKFNIGIRDATTEAKYGFVPGPRILSLGRLVERKGFDMTIRALAEMQTGDAHYYIAGTGPYDSTLRSLTKEMGVTDRVHFLGFVPDKDLSDVYNCADIYCMPSRELAHSVEGFGITYLEAASCEVPSLGGLGSGAEDAIVQEETGLLVDPESPSDIAAALERLLDNPEERREMGKRAWKRVTESLTWEKMVDQLLDFIDESLNGELSANQ